MNHPFIQFNNITLAEPNRTVFSNFSWEMNDNEIWAIVGDTGAGKTSFLKAIAGEYFLKKGNIAYTLNPIEAPLTDFGDLQQGDIAFVPFKEDSTVFHYANHYYQQRYNATESNEGVTVNDFLQQASENTLTSEQKEILQFMNIERLQPLPFIQLSNGETRRVRLAKALLNNPKLLLLDQPFVGLDTTMRTVLTQYIDKIAQRGVRIIMVVSPNELPNAITHVLQLQHSQIKQATSKQDFELTNPNQPPLTQDSKLRTSDSGLRTQDFGLRTSDSGLRTSDSGLRTSDFGLLTQDSRLRTLDSRLRTSDFGLWTQDLHFQRKKRQSSFKLAVSMENVTIQYGEKIILKDLDWKVQKGEKWALLGRNGSGKTTLLSLIYGDNPQAYGMKIKLFDRRRGSGESIWEIKKKIGFTSPEIQFYFEHGATCEAAAASGFFDAMTIERSLSKRELQNLIALFRFYDLEHLMEQPFDSISEGLQRVILLIRALVKDPPLLILDEPFQSMDTHFLNRSKELLRQYCESNKTLIMVTHHAHEIPEFVDKVLHLT